MFTDMVGYSSLAQRNEALALDLLDEHRRVVRGILPAHSGREVKTTGDGFLLEFNSALAAVQCAIEIQRALHSRNSSSAPDRAVHMRIGIHVGDVVTRDGDIHGDGVNIAARIEPLALPGGICVSEDVKRQVQNKISQPFVKFSAAPLKNIDSPIEIYHLQLDSTPIPSVKTPAPAPAQHKSIAVLPFTNMSSDRENDFLSDGITEDLITALSKISGLRVPARTSSFAFRGKNEDIRVIGEKLSVTTVLAGSVRKSGNRLRITAQLINVSDGFHLWSEKFDRELQDVFVIQDEITRSIISALKVKLVGESEAQLFKAPTDSLEAYQLYLKGREFWYQRGIGLKKSLHYFELAILEDPNYALAYSGLADTLMSLTFYGYGQSADLVPKARQAALRCLELHPDLAEGYLSLATIKSWHDWQFDEADAAYRKAIELKPNFSLAHSFYATHLCGARRPEDSIAQAACAVDLDPLSPFSIAFLGWMHSWSGLEVEATPHVKKSLDLSPNYALAHWILGQNLVARRSFAEGIASLEKAAELTNHAAWVLGLLSSAYAAAGEQEKALSLLSVLEDPKRQPFVRAVHGALVHAALGNTDLAFERLEQAFSERDLWLRWLWSHSAFNSLHSDPRFLDLAKRIGLPLQP